MNADMGLGTLITILILLVGLTLAAGMSWWWWLGAFAVGFVINVVIAGRDASKELRRAQELEKRKVMFARKAIVHKASEWNDMADAMHKSREG